MLQLNNLKPAKGARKNRRRLGRGQGSGRGTTAGRGMKGQSSRSGGGSHPWFEGGQMPLYRRVPKKGFWSPNRVPNQIVNLADFERFDASQEINIDYLRGFGLATGPFPKVKILGNGDVSGAFKVRVHGISASARQKIEAAGGSVEVIAYDTKRQKVVPS